MIPLEPDITSSLHLVVVPHTHWDREWYQPFQEFRSRLVRLMDRLLDVLERDPAFTHFHLDGQTIVLEDYLEIRPQNRRRLQRLIRAGRIAVGPWYVLPDEFLVSGESLIRNLQIGHRIAAQFGMPARVGYLPDQFGHTAQMPQLLAGFGIDCAVVWRGVGADVTRTLFTWEAPDGTAVFTVYMPISGYSNGRALPEDPEALRQHLATIIAEQAPYRRIPALLLMSGTDHQEPQAALPQALAAATRAERGLTYEIAPLRRFIDTSRASTEGLERHRGELRSPLRAHVIPGVTSVRVRQKQRDFDTVSCLERYAEPLATWADLLGGQPALTDFTNWAWKTAVQNHPHDSICGCSVDQVHRDMEHRFDQVELLGKQVLRQAFAALVQQLDRRRGAPGSAVVVYNPNGSGPGLVCIEAAALDGEAAYVVEDDAGRTAPVHVAAAAREVLFAAEVSREEARPHVQALQSREFLGMVINEAVLQRAGDRLSVVLTMEPVMRGQLDIAAARQRWIEQLDDPTLHTVAVRVQSGAPTRVSFCAPQLTGYGFTVFALRRAEATPAAVCIAGPRAIENAHFRVIANDDGSLAITDLSTGTVLPRCNWFVDEGDRGDEYNFDPLQDPQCVMAPAGPPLVTVDPGVGVLATLTVEQSYEIPRQLGADRDTRSPDRVAVPITTRVRLHAGIKRIDFETVVDNRAADHRLRVHVQTPLHVSTAFMEQAFTTVERGLDLESGDGFERPVGTGPQKTFTCIEDGVTGVALFNRGIPEIEVRRTSTGTEIALTLIRAVGWLSRGDLRWRRGPAGPGLETPDAQSLGVHRFEYALTTYSGSWQHAGVVAAAHAFAYPPLAMVTDAFPGPLPPDAALIRCDNPNVVVSALAPSKRRGAFVVRCYNTSAVPQRATLQCPGAKRIRLVNFLEQPVLPPPARVRSTRVHVQLRPFEIMTLQVSTRYTKSIGAPAMPT